MRMKSRYLFLLFSLLIFVLPAEAGADTISGSDNIIPDSGWNGTQNISDFYYNSSTGSACTAAGEIIGYGEEIPSDGFVEGITFLTASPESEEYPVWTADGNYILYTIKENDLVSSYRMKENGNNKEKTDIGEGNLTGFSDIDLNGTEMVLTRAINSNSGLYIANLKNGKLTRVADDPDKSEGWGAWCRLGRKIAYTQESINSSSQLWRVDRDGSNKTRLGSSENVGIGKDWCPLGLRIIYSAKNSKEKDDLWAIDWYGTNETQITDTPYGEWNPAFSPDGKKIVYVSDEGGSPEIWIRDIDGHYRARLTNNLGIVDSNPKWSPDGLKIVFTARNLHNTLEISPINGTNVNSIDYLNSSMNNSSDSSNNLNYNSESSEVDGSEIEESDIAVIKLSFSSAVSPIPKLTGFRIDSLSGISGEKAASITITAKNEGKNSSEGYIWVSFPEEKEIENVEGTGSNITIYNSGSFLKSKEGQVMVQYPLVEMVEYDWGRGQEETLNVKVVPGNETEEIIFFVRAGLKDDLTGNYSRDPLVSDTVDQQGFEAYRYSTHIT